jgi:hypothetical protein
MKRERGSPQGFFAPGVKVIMHRALQCLPGSQASFEVRDLGIVILAAVALVTILVLIWPAAAQAADPPAPVRYDHLDWRLSYSGTWAEYAKTVAWKGSYGRSATSGASVTITFTGTRLDWIAMKGITTGIADVYMDGTKKATINLASATAVYQQNVWSTGTLSDTTHVVKIVRSSSSASLSRPSTPSISSARSSLPSTRPSRR